MKQRIVFIGDSITWWGMNEDDDIGTGYVRLLHDYLKVTYSERELEIINKGIGGHRVIDLAERWDRDVISLQPDIVSISIGINDVARQFDSPDIEQMYPERFEEIYDSLLKAVKEKTGASIVLMEPTIFKEDIQSEGNNILKSYVAITHKLAEKYKATVVPTHQAFIEVLKSGNDLPLTTDGVHMTTMGNMLMAKTWVQATRSLLG
ncbi:SGNH/GDSL hydrolase family protein [Bacillus tianshenii]|uniref:SGNH/GDSL hydrolase family protein n=1 Tax=Sutcliffiella tianshenii TaxID=1463404 RepID=UPI001CD577BA|nr:SGNH/GDSL hydrolase family protein [Bacillus tianshenii]MCA1318468.1 SGNH/GDSL hydrolase family protein [Bacillus tianshenii]